MAGKTDRERAEELARDRERKEIEAKAEENRRHSAIVQERAHLLAQDQQKTAEILQHCQKEFSGFKLAPTGHEVSVRTAESSRVHDIEADDVEYVYLYISHWGEETGNFQGQIPVLLTRYRNGQYELIDADGKRTVVKTFDQLKNKLVEALSSMNRDCMKRLFAKVRSRLGK